MHSKNYCDNLTNKLEQDISDICNNQYKYFLSKKNVQGIALGYKIQNGFYTTQLSIKVFVSRKLPKNQLNCNDIVPSMYKGIPTDVKESGYFTPCSFNTKMRPVLGGYSVSAYENEDMYSTAGCLVTNKVSNFVLSTNHSFAKLNTLPLGSPVVQPARKYGGAAPNDTIATLHRYIPLRFIDGELEPTNLSDCALGLLTKPTIMNNEIALIGKLNAVKSPRLNAKVRKVGATTELTEGTITDINAVFRINYPTGQRALFKEQFFTTRMSQRGDSGSILVNTNNCPLGILVSADNDATTFSRLNIVLDQLGVNLVT